MGRFTLLPVKCGPTCNPHPAWDPHSQTLVVAFLGAEGMAVVRTRDPTGRGGWGEPTLLAPAIGAGWATSLPGAPEQNKTNRQTVKNKQNKTNRRNKTKQTKETKQTKQTIYDGGGPSSFLRLFLTFSGQGYR